MLLKPGQAPVQWPLIYQWLTTYPIPSTNNLFLAVNFLVDVTNMSLLFKNPSDIRNILLLPSSGDNRNKECNGDHALVQPMFGLAVYKYTNVLRWTSKFSELKCFIILENYTIMQEPWIQPQALVSSSARHVILLQFTPKCQSADTTLMCNLATKEWRVLMYCTKCHRFKSLKNLSQGVIFTDLWN